MCGPGKVDAVREPRVGQRTVSWGGLSLLQTVLERSQVCRPLMGLPGSMFRILDGRPLPTVSAGLLCLEARLSQPRPLYRVVVVAFAPLAVGEVYPEQTTMEAERPSAPEWLMYVRQSSPEDGKASGYLAVESVWQLVVLMMRRVEMFVCSLELLAFQATQGLESCLLGRRELAQVRVQVRAEVFLPG